MNAAMMKPISIKTLSERIVYQNDFVTVRDDIVQFPDGSTGTYYYPQWKSPHGVMIVPLHQDRVLLIKCYRYAEKSFSVEVPQGFGTAGATPVEDARRELFEETGLQSAQLEPVFVFGSLYQTHLFACRLREDAPIDCRATENSEVITERFFVPLSEVSVPLLASIGMFDPLSIAGLLMVKALADDDLLLK